MKMLFMLNRNFSNRCYYYVIQKEKTVWFMKNIQVGPSSRHLLNIFLYIAIYYVIFHKTENHSFSSTILPDLIRLLLFKDTTGSEDITFK